MGLGAKCLEVQSKGQGTFYSTTEAWVMPAPSSKKPEELEFVVDSGASMHMLSKRDESSGELDSLRKSRIPTTVITANGEVQTSVEAQVYVHDLALFVTVQILDDTRAVLSLGKLCEEHGFSHEWASGQKPHLTKNGKGILCKTENFAPVDVPGLSSSCIASSSSTSFPQNLLSTSPSPASIRSDGTCYQAAETDAMIQKSKNKIKNEDND